MDEVVDQADKEIKEVLTKHNLEMGYEFDFPIYRQLPDEVQLAMKILASHGLKVLFVLKHKKE